MSDLLTFQPGVSLADGRYLLRSAVQPGRWSVTIHAIRAQDLTAVIIKTPIAAQGKSRFQSAWTRRTFQALGDLNHPSRSRILDWFEQDGRPFLVFQKVKGQSLAERLQQGPLSEAVALQLIRQVAAGLAGIHSQGLLHRDIQPKNIIFRQGVGLPTLVDWGLQPAQVPGDRLTPFGAPEQIQGGDIFKHRLDIYSLTATLYTAVTGQLPVDPAKRQYWVPNPSPADLAGLIPPRQFCPDLSSATEQAILQGMALDPQWRPATLDNWLHLFPLTQSPGGLSNPSQSVNRRSAQSHASPSAHDRPSSSSCPVTANSDAQQTWATQPPRSQILAQPAAASSPVAKSTDKPEAKSTAGLTAKSTDNTAQAKQSLAPYHLAFSSSPSHLLKHRSSTPSNTRSQTGPARTIQPQPVRFQTAPAKASISSANRLASQLRATTQTGSPSSTRQTPNPQATSSQTMVHSHNSPQAPFAGSPFRPLKRLTSITVLMASIGLAGGLLLRVLNPGSVAGFSGLGRVQDFPETDWPGEAQLDDVPEGVPQPEYDGDRWDDRWDDSEAELPEVILDEELRQDEVLAIPSERLEEFDRIPQRSTVDGDSDRWEQPEQAWPERGAETEANRYGSSNDNSAGANGDYSGVDYGGAESSDGSNSDGGDIGSSAGSYNSGDAAISENDGWQNDWENDGWNDDSWEGESQNSDGWNAAPESQPSQESWSDDAWTNEAAQDWQAPSSITADDFPEPELPPPYEAPAPQGTLPLTGEGNGSEEADDILYEDV